MFWSSISTQKKGSQNRKKLKHKHRCKTKNVFRMCIERVFSIEKRIQINKIEKHRFRFFVWFNRKYTHADIILVQTYSCTYIDQTRCG